MHYNYYSLVSADFARVRLKMTNQQLNSSKSSLKKVENDNTNSDSTTKTKKT
jgi:hypothetical protein